MKYSLDRLPICLQVKSCGRERLLCISNGFLSVLEVHHVSSKSILTRLAGPVVKAEAIRQTRSGDDKSQTRLLALSTGIDNTIAFASGDARQVARMRLPADKGVVEIPRGLHTKDRALSVAYSTTLDCIFVGWSEGHVDVFDYASSERIRMMDPPHRSKTQMRRTRSTANALKVELLADPIISLCTLDLLEKMLGTRPGSTSRQRSNAGIRVHFGTAAESSSAKTETFTRDQFEPRALVIGGGLSGTLYLWALGERSHRFLRFFDAHERGVMWVFRSAAACR